MAFKVVTILIGVLLIVFNRQFSAMVGYCQKLTMGHSFEGWTNRLPAILGGVIAILVALYD